MFYFIKLLRTFAALIITNSHFDSLYPNPIFSTGGAFGNAVFFIVSGFCLINTKAPIKKWYPKRLLRIYPQVIIASALRLLLTDISIGTGITGLLMFFIFPTSYWFIASILVCYLIYYAVLHTRFRNHIPAAIGLLSGIYFICYTTVLDTSVMIIEEYTVFRSIFYLMVMLTGGWLRIKKDEGTLLSSHPSLAISSGILTIVSALFWAATYVLILKFPILIRFQLFIHVFVFIFAAALLLFCICMEHKLVCKANHLPDKIISLISSVTLEIYLVQYLIIPYCRNIIFPLNIVTALVVTVIAAWLLHQVTAYLLSFVTALFQKE